MFRLLVESVRDYAIFMLDPQGRVASWNIGAQNIKGYTREEIVGKDFSIFYTPDAVQRRWPQLELALALERGRFEDEGWRVRKDGTQFWANVVIAPIRDGKNRLRGFAKVTRDLTARRQIEDLQRGERQVNEFLAMLAHELRNPLAPIHNALDVVERKPDDPTLSRWAREIIHRQVAQLSRLVDDLLDVGRITRGKIDLKPEVIDLRVAIEQSIESVRSSIDAHRHTLELTLASEPLFIRVDAMRVEQIVANLLSNAVKYTNDEGRISVRCVAIGDLASVTVSDNGMGMSAELLPRVFDLFVQGERALDRRGGGLGVGLTLAKRLTQMLGGTLTATSAGVGLGSSFILAFPMIEQPRQRTGTQLESAVPSASQRHLDVLVVDDNDDAADALAALLDILGHRPTVLHDGTDALRVAPVDVPDVVLLDIGLPDMDGIEVAKRLRAMPELDRTRLIACTGYSHADDARKIVDAGFDLHLVKPITAADLERVLQASDGLRVPTNRSLEAGLPGTA